MQYDAAIIGAGADGLAAAAMLARAGLRIVVAERGTRPGGRLATSEFHPGFRASLFADEIAPIPPHIFRALNLARHGALFTAPGAPAMPEAEALREAALARALAEADVPPPRFSFFPRARPAPWPGAQWSSRSLAELMDDPRILAALASRAGDSQLAGSALHLLAPRCGSGMVKGGLGSLGAALAANAQEAGAELRLGLEVSEVRQSQSRATGLVLANGEEIAARAILSTLDLKHSFLSLFKWSELPKPLVARIGNFRMAGSQARLLIALEKPPSGISAAPLYLNPAPAAALAAWRSGAIAQAPPLTLRLVSACDPSLAPATGAVLTATIGCVPYRLFDGPWTHDKRETLRKRVLAMIEVVLPGLARLGSELIVPPDIEEALGLTAGDLDGGEIAPDQMLEFRPGPRTAIRGFYLAGPSCAAGPLGSCAAGIVAARALLADLA